MKQHLLIGFLLAALGIALAGRLIPHPPNFTPVGALALFAGIYLARKSMWFLMLPLAAMFLTDLAIGFYDIKLMLVVYGGFLLYGVFGLLIAKNRNLGTITIATLAGSFLFYLTTNFAVWAFSPFYAANLSGLMLSYTMALPFLKYMILGDVFFIGIFVGTYELAVHLVRQEKLKLRLSKLLTL